MLQVFQRGFPGRLRVPQKITIGPWFHQQTTGLNNVAEHLRWYDYWLKGIDNGIMREPIRSERP